MLESSPYAPFEQLERLERAEASKPLRVRVQGDHAVADSDRPAHGFVPILLERRDGRWRVDLVETWKNLFFDSKGDYHQKNNNHPYAFALDRFDAGGRYGVEPWQLATGDLAAVRRTLVQRGRAFDEYLLAELLYRNCWLPIDALSHYERAIELSPHNWLFNETLAGRAAFVGFHDLAASAYAELGSAGLLWLAQAQRAAGDGDAAIASARRALERDPYWIEAHDLLRALLEAKGDQSGARAEQARADAIRSDPRRPGAALTIAFDPPYPVLHSDAPTKVGDTDVYDHSYFAATLANPSGRAVEIESAILISDGTAERSGLGDIKDYWRYPSGSHRLRAGESVKFARTWGFTVKTGHQQLRYVFDVCWKADGERQCRDYRVDLFPPFDEIGLVDPEAAAVRVPAEDDRVKRAHPAIAARLELLALLRGRRFDELTRRVETAQAAFEADPGREEQVAQMWDTFGTSDPSFGALLQAWAAASDSYAPLVALGIHHRRSGWGIYEAPGVPASVSRERAKPHVDEARRQLHRALEIHPRLAIALEHLINLEKVGPAIAESRRLADEAARLCPSCIGPSFEHLFALTPRWGGSYEQMQQYLADLAPRIAKFPRLAVLRGAPAWDRGASGRFGRDYEAALRSYDEALLYGDYWQYRRFRGDALYRLERFDEALADHEYWIAHGARAGAALLAKTYDLGSLRRYAEAAETVELAQRLEPTDDEIVRLATYYRGQR
jgi:tetratricopeptide (TPR) repeat protein